MELCEYGYTPNNYKKLVELSGLSNVDFYRQFNIKEQTFYKHIAGDRTMKWRDWKKLYSEVEKFITAKGLV